MKRIFPISLIVLTCLSLASCSVIEGIFKAGVWSGIIIVVVVVALVIWLLAKLFGGGNKN
jgi:predicted small secreted protein